MWGVHAWSMCQCRCNSCPPPITMLEPSLPEYHKTTRRAPIKGQDWSTCKEITLADPRSPHHHSITLIELRTRQRHTEAHGDSFPMGQSPTRSSADSCFTQSDRSSQAHSFVQLHQFNDGGFSVYPMHRGWIQD